MTQFEKSFATILSNFRMDFSFELLLLYKSELLFVRIERLVLSWSVLPLKQQNIILNKAEKYKTNKAKFMNLLHDLAIPMLSVKV